MFYGQCFKCGESWALGTERICKCPDELLAEQPAYRAVKTFHEGKPVYVAEQPTQRTWVGLSDEEIEAEFGFINELLRDCSYRIEAKLKEKNT